MKKFAIIGVGGYIAPRHIQAINDTGNRICAAMDVNDSVGILDRYTQDVAFFTSFEEFESFVENKQESNDGFDFLTICSPNYLHASHIKFGLRHGMNVICEKPLVLNEKELDELIEYENKFNKKVYTVLQLRVHESIIKLKDELTRLEKSKINEIELTYLTSRGPWYHQSWKGELKKSGGLASNIGVHFFDMLAWLFGEIKTNELHYKDDHMVSGFLEFENARVKWILSVDRGYLPKSAVEQGKTTYRSIMINEKELEFSGGFTDLHTKVYKDILDGKGYGLNDARTAIKIVERLRSTSPMLNQSTMHPMLKEKMEN